MGGQGLGGSPNLIFRAIGCRPLEGEYGVFLDKFCEVFFDRVRAGLHATFVDGKLLLIDIFVHVSFGHVRPYKAKLLFYVSEPSSNRRSRFPESGSPTGFTARHTTRQRVAGVRGAADRVR